METQRKDKANSGLDERTMKVPNADGAIIDPKKFIEKALCFEHDDGKHKAILFRDVLGITTDNLDLLLDALGAAVVQQDATTGKRDRYGQRYTVEFDFMGPGGAARLRSAWIVRTGEEMPRLVTCYII